MGTARYKPYPAYKPSGVEWLGDIPEGWETTPVKKIAKIVNGYPFDAKRFDAASGTPLVRIRDLNSSMSEMRYNGRIVDTAVITNKDVLIGMDGDFNVGRWLGSGAALLNQRMCCVRGKSDEITRFLEYVLPAPLTLINDITYSTTVKHLSSYQVEKLRISVPQKREELTSILAFLDYETGKIDALIAKQERLIALLEEKRQAVISHAVTKGLNPNAPLRPSGIDWLGDVPEHWEVSQFGYISEVVRGASPRPAGDPTLFNGDYSPWVTVAEITKDDEVYLSETETCLTRKGSEQCRVFRSGTLLISNSGATLGVPKILKIDANANDGVVGFENLKIDEKFCYHFLTAMTEQLRERIKQGSGQPNLNTDIIKKIPVTLPPSDEIATIVDFVELSRTRFRELAAKAQSAITLLKERRTALISAAVTGKIDVRDWQTPQPVSDTDLSTKTLQEAIG